MRYPLAVLILVLPACEGPDALPGEPDEAYGDSTSIAATEGPVGLPEIRNDGSCVTPFAPTFSAWVHGPDAVVTGTVADVRLNKQIVYSTSSTPSKEITWGECDESSVTGISLLVDLEDVRVVGGDMGADTVTLTIGAGETGLWVPTPFWDAQTGLNWGGEGAILGPQLQLGAALFWDAERDVWNGQWLFEVDTDGSIAFPQIDDACVELPAELASVDTIQALRSEAARVPEPDAATLDAYRDFHMPDDAGERERSRLATLCLEESFVPEDPPEDPEATP